MSARDDQDAPAPTRPARQRPARSVSPLPPPEEVFIDWLMSVPHGADLEAAARSEINLIDGCIHPHPDVQRLRVLLAVVAGERAWRRQTRIL